jgi:hypothetical protein
MRGSGLGGVAEPTEAGDGAPPFDDEVERAQAPVASSAADSVRESTGAAAGRRGERRARCANVK